MGFFNYYFNADCFPWSKGPKLWCIIKKIMEVMSVGTDNNVFVQKGVI